MHTRVIAPARLHFGLFNESGLDGRIDGGAGMAISSPVYDLSVGEVDPLTSPCHLSQEMQKTIDDAVATFQAKFGLPTFKISIAQSIPEHVGLGSKTACLMALAYAIREHFRLDMSYMQLAELVHRGGTSGVGVHVSKFGGIVLDAGHAFPNEKFSFVPSSKSLASPPPLVQAQTAPKESQIVYVKLDSHGISGDLEREFFSRHCPLPEGETRRLLEVVETQLLPGIRSHSLPEINRSLASIQDLGLKAREWSIQGAATQALRRKWRDNRCSAELPLCLSSMGPTLFILTDSPDFVRRQLVACDVPQQSISVTHPWSGGYRIEH